MTTDRKAAVTAFKERKPSPGIYAIRCSASGETWVGSAPDLASIATRHWFSLRMGGHTQPSLQQAWNRHGEAAFGFEIIERFADDAAATPISAGAVRDRVRFWAAELGGKAI